MGRSRKASAKREEGLKKKARELATLCGVDVCLVGVAPDGSFFCWPDDISEVGRIAERYLEAGGGSGNDGEAPAFGGTKRKRTAAAVAAGETARSVVPRPKRAKGSQRDEPADTREELERAQGEGSDSGARVVGSPNIPFDFAPVVASHPEITGTGSAHIGWLTVPLLAPSPPSAILGCPAAAELGCGGHPAEPVLDCGGDIIGEFLLHLSSSPAQDVLPCDLELLPAVYGSSTLGIPDEGFFHSGGAPVDDWDVPETCQPSAILGCPAAAELGYGGHLAEPVLDCGGDIIGEFLLHLSSSPAQDVLSCDLGLLPAVYGSSTLGIPDEDFFHGGGAPVDDWDVLQTYQSSAWEHMAPPETAVGVGYDPALSGVSACPPSSSGGTDSGPLGMAAAGFYDSEAETISLLLSSPSWSASQHVIM